MAGSAATKRKRTRSPAAAAPAADGGKEVESAGPERGGDGGEGDGDVRTGGTSEAAAGAQTVEVEPGDAARAERSSRKKSRTEKGALQSGGPSAPPSVAIHPDKEKDPWAVPVSPFFKINSPPRDRPVRIYSDGIFDLFHFGHAKALEQAKKAFPSVYLLVGVCNDELTHLKKGKTVLTDKERYESIRHCRWVDEVIPDAPWTIDAEFLDKHEIDYVAHDDIPYVSEGTNDVYAFVKERGQFLPTRRTEGVSTSDLITRIVRDYDSYLRRNLERGISAKELNIGFLKSRELQMKKKVDDLRKDWRGIREDFMHELGELKNEIRQAFSSWEDRSSDIVRGFAQLFGSDGVVGKILRIRSASAPPTDDEDTGNESDAYNPRGSRGQKTSTSPQHLPLSPLAGLFGWVAGREEEMGDEEEEEAPHE